jgi:hypothetical protein
MAISKYKHLEENVVEHVPLPQDVHTFHVGFVSRWNMLKLKRGPIRKSTVVLDDESLSVVLWIDP